MTFQNQLSSNGLHPDFVVLIWIQTNESEKVVESKERVHAKSTCFPSRPRGYKTVFMHNSTERGISTAHKIKLEEVSLSLSDVVFIMLINFKMPKIVGILTFMSKINFVLSWAEHKKSFITLILTGSFCVC